ncbi:MAG: hypothetical protein QG602_2879 [Verrucomicrobiota bacterium]|nr:hypothetical protein [Verrucomicrobiota bacterium]
MSLNESIVEDAALEWFGELGYAVGHGPHLAPGEPAAERDSFGEVVLVGRLREAIQRLNPAISSRTLLTMRVPAVAGLPKLLSGELSVAAASATMEASV